MADLSGIARVDSEIPLEDLEIGLGQVRVSDTAKGIDELVDSIKKIGLLEPIVVAPGSQKGKYEILTGQRRYLAHKLLHRPTIRASILAREVDETEAKVISVSENLVRRDLNRKDLIDACTVLYRKYGNMKMVAEETGLPYDRVREYVKFDRLVPQLRKLVEEGEVDLKTALRAQDATTTDSGEVNEDEAVQAAMEMRGMSGAQQTRIKEERQQNPDRPIDDVIEDAKSGAKITQIVVTLGANVHRELQRYAEAEDTNQDDAAADLIAEGLSTKGYAGE